MTNADMDKLTLQDLTSLPLAWQVFTLHGLSAVNPATFPLPDFERTLRMLDEYIVADVECAGPPIHLPDGSRCWYDVRPMLDEREHSPEFIDTAREAIAWGLHRRVLRQHPDVPHLIQCSKVGR